MIVMRRFPSAASKILLDIAYLSPRLVCSLVHNEALERKPAFCDDLITLSKPRDDFDGFLAAGAKPHNRSD
jgi:hypothetical protein